MPFLASEQVEACQCSKKRFPYSSIPLRLQSAKRSRSLVNLLCLALRYSMDRLLYFPVERDREAFEAEQSPSLEELGRLFISDSQMGQLGDNHRERNRRFQP